MELRGVRRGGFHPPGVFDAPWQFGIWLFISNLIQIHLMPLIMVGQNLQARHAQMRVEQEFHISQQVDRELEIVLRYLERMNRVMSAMDERLGEIEHRGGAPL